MNIRPERPSDYAEISELHAHAFNNRVGEPMVVALQRQRRRFDPDLSLVAEIDGQIRGHVLFSPYEMRLLDQTITIVNLAPIAVDPAYQKQGIGGRLIREGHAAAKAKGYLISIVLGYPTYYTHFGYHTHAFGSAQLTLPLPLPTNDILTTRPPTTEDISVLTELWQQEEQHVDMALHPETSLLDWLSPHPAIKATIYTNNNTIVGYTRIHQDEPTSPRVFYAQNAERARAMLSTMSSKLPKNKSVTTYTLPLHPYSASASELGLAESKTWEAAMACELAPSPLFDYLNALQEKRRPAGRVIWPVAFDLA